MTATKLGFSLYDRWRKRRARKRIDTMFNLVERLTGEKFYPWQRDIVTRVLESKEDK